MPILPLLLRRSFSSTVRRDATYGFIGLGKMGMPMARNLRQKLPKEDTLYVYDVNKAAIEGFKAEFEGGVELADGVAEVVASSVGFSRFAGRRGRGGVADVPRKP